MDSVGLNVESDLVVGVVGGFNHPLESTDVYDYLVVVALKGDRCNLSDKHTLVFGHYINVLGTDNNVNGLVFVKAGVKALEGVPRKADAVIVKHYAVDDIALAYKVGNKGVLGLVVYINRTAYLLDLTVCHYNDGVRHGKSLFLVVGYVYKGNTRFLTDIFKLVLHILAKLQVKSGKGLVKKQYLGAVYKSARNGNSLLLTARQSADVSLFKSAKIYKLKHFADFFLYFIVFRLLDSQSEGDIFKYVQVRKQCIFLKNCIDRTLVRGHIVDTFAVKEYVAGIRRNKSAYNTQGCGLAAAGWAQKGYKFIIVNVEIDTSKHYFAIKIHADILQLDKLVIRVFHF